MRLDAEGLKDRQAWEKAGYALPEFDREKVKEKWEKALRKVRWCFPDYHYMASIYPMVEKIPPLLPVFWIIRGVRLLTRAIKG